MLINKLISATIFQIQNMYRLPFTSLEIFFVPEQAYIFMIIEAMADAAVADGMPRAQAYKFAAQSVYGAAKMVLETGRHPGELKDAVCSPGGTTIEAVAALERGGLRDTVITAQRACSKKSHDMSTAK